MKNSNKSVENSNADLNLKKADSERGINENDIASLDLSNILEEKPNKSGFRTIPSANKGVSGDSDVVSDDFDLNGVLERKDDEDSSIAEAESEDDFADEGDGGIVFLDEDGNRVRNLSMNNEKTSLKSEGLFSFLDSEGNPIGFEEDSDDDFDGEIQLKYADDDTVVYEDESESETSVSDAADNGKDDSADEYSVPFETENDTEDTNVDNSEETVEYVDEDGNPVEYVDEDGNPVEYVDEDGNPVEYVDEENSVEETEIAEQDSENAEELAENIDGDFVDYEATEEETPIDENLDSTDINLMLAFGLDDELERTMGADAARKLTDELDEEQRKRTERVRKTVDNEYVNRTQTSGFAKEYKTKYRNTKIKLIVSILVSIVLFGYENLRMFGFEFAGAFDATVYPVVYIMGSLQLLLICAACAYEQLLNGLFDMFRGKFNTSSVCAVSVLGAIAYSAVLCKTTKLAHYPLVINFAVALMLVFLLVSEYFNVRREIFSFNIVSSKREKHIVSIVPVSEETDNFDPEDGDMLKFEVADFIDNYFTRTQDQSHSTKLFSVAVVVISVISAAVAGVFTRFTSTSEGVMLTSAIIENAFCAFFIATPVSMLISVSYPFYRASRNAYDNDGAIIGETSLEEYCNAGCVTFDDVGVFPSHDVRVQNVKIYNNHRIDRVLYYASSVFSEARGPLTEIFNTATAEIGHSEDVRIKAAGTGYLAVNVDGKNIHFGSADELLNRGFDIPVEITDEDEERDNGVCVMYMFREDRLMAKMYIKYTIDPEFEAMMAALSEEGISVSVKTYDPNIDDRLIAQEITYKDEYVYSVSRYSGSRDGRTVKENADSGIVSRGSAKGLLDMITECTKVLSSRRAGIIIGILSSVVSALLMVVVIMSGKVDSMTSAVIALYNIFWLIPTFICGNMYVR